MLSHEQTQSFREHGYLILRDVLSPEETTDLRRWSQEVHDWPTDESSPWMPYQEINNKGKKVLCRTENYANSHSGFNGLLRGSKLLGLLAELAGEDMSLFKEKINYKLAGSGGFAPHVDSTAYTHIKNVKHLTILLAVDPSNMSNGGLEVVDGSHDMIVPVGKDNCIEPEWVKKQKWTPVTLEAEKVAPSDMKCIDATSSTSSEFAPVRALTPTWLECMVELMPFLLPNPNGYLDVCERLPDANNEWYLFEPKEQQRSDTASFSGNRLTFRWQLLVFGSYLAHRSGANHSNVDRKAIYATYNCAREGDLHDDYYAHRKVIWPPMQLRQQGNQYEEGALRYGFGSPMLSVDAGKQLEFEGEKPSPQNAKAAKTASVIIDILRSYGQSDYIGEPISQIEHSLQCANLASKNSADAQTIVAALLHDIGQIMPVAEAEKLLGGSKIQDMHQEGTGSNDPKSTDSVGRVSHETLGAQYLLALGFPSKVAELVEAHVPAKRYLCATEEGYHDTLSDASKESLRFQGGPMSPEEVHKWQEDRWATEKANLRRWDDGAKVIGLEVPGVETYRPALEQVLIS